MLATTLLLCACKVSDASLQHEQSAMHMQDSKEVKTMQVQYLEVVTPKVDETCELLESMHGVSFGEPDAGLGNARSAKLKSGGMIGVRAPMRDTEEPVVRPYLLVEDIEAAVEAARAAGAEIAIPAMEIPDHGKFAIYILGGIEHGLWQL